jgi:hypothetical protein
VHQRPPRGDPTDHRAGVVGTVGFGGVGATLGGSAGVVVAGGVAVGVGWTEGVGVDVAAGFDPPPDFVVEGTHQAQMMTRTPAMSNRTTEAL